MRFIENKKAFTLIEVLIYISLSSLLLTGVIVSTFSLIDLNKMNLNKSLAFEEGHFILQKINFLKNKKDDIFQLYEESGRIWIKYENSDAEALTSSAFSVEDFNFSENKLKFYIDGIYFEK